MFNRTKSSTLNISSSPLALFTCTACDTLARIKLSFASFTSMCTYRIRFSPVCSSVVLFSPGMSGCISHGDWPKCNWKGVKPGKQFIIFVKSNCTCGSARTQPFWFLAMWNRRAWIIVLFVRSLAPSVLGWYTMDIFKLIPIRVCSTFQNWLRKSLSRSLTILNSRPFSQNQWSKKRSTSWDTIIKLWVGIKQISEFKRSVIVIK